MRRTLFFLAVGVALSAFPAGALMSSTSPETVFAVSFGVDDAASVPLTVSACTTLCTPVTVTLPEIDLTSTVAPAGTMTV